MPKFVKIIAIGLGSLLALGVLATVALRVLYPPAKLRLIVEEQIRKQINREAQLGDVRLGLGGLSLSRFKLSEVPAFSAGTFLAVEKMDVRWSLMPLLSKKISIKAIVLDKPQINLVRMADGKTTNISDLTASPAKPAKAKDAPAMASKAGAPAKAETGKTAGGWSWQVNGINLRHGTVQLTDRSPAKLSSVLSDIDLNVRDFDPTRVHGRLTVGQLQNPVYKARDFALEWALQNIDPTLAHVNGWIRLKQGDGLIENLSSLAASSPVAKLALMPLVMLQNLDKLGFINLGLPNFSHLPITDIDGDYAFKEGSMKINKFNINSPEMTLTSLGTIELASGALAVDVNLDTPKPTALGAMKLQMHISGTLSNPKTNLDSLKKKAFKASVGKILDKSKSDVKKNVNETIKNIFH